MVILKRLPFIDTLDSMQEIAELDTLANLKKHLAARSPTEAKTLPAFPVL